MLSNNKDKITTEEEELSFLDKMFSTFVQELLAEIKVVQSNIKEVLENDKVYYPIIKSTKVKFWRTQSFRKKREMAKELYDMAGINITTLTQVENFIDKYKSFVEKNREIDKKGGSFGSILNKFAEPIEYLNTHHKTILPTFTKLSAYRRSICHHLISIQKEMKEIKHLKQKDVTNIHENRSYHFEQIGINQKNALDNFRHLLLKNQLDIDMQVIKEKLNTLNSNEKKVNYLMSIMRSALYLSCEDKKEFLNKYAEIKKEFKHYIKNPDICLVKVREIIQLKHVNYTLKNLSIDFESSIYEEGNQNSLLGNNESELDRIHPFLQSSITPSHKFELKLDILNFEKTNVKYTNLSSEAKRRYLLTRLLIKEFADRVQVEEKKFLLAAGIRHSQDADIKMYKIYNEFIGEWLKEAYLSRKYVTNDKQFEIIIEEANEDTEPADGKKKYQLKRENTKYETVTEHHTIEIQNADNFLTRELCDDLIELINERMHNLHETEELLKQISEVENEYVIKFEKLLQELVSKFQSLDRQSLTAFLSSYKLSWLKNVENLFKGLKEQISVLDTLLVKAENDENYYPNPKINKTESVKDEFRFLKLFQYAQAALGFRVNKKVLRKNDSSRMLAGVGLTNPVQSTTKLTTSKLGLFVSCSANAEFANGSRCPTPKKMDREHQAALRC